MAPDDLRADGLLALPDVDHGLRALWAGDAVLVVDDIGSNESSPSAGPAATILALADPLTATSSFTVDDAQPSAAALVELLAGAPVTVRGRFVDDDGNGALAGAAPELAAALGMELMLASHLLAAWYERRTVVIREATARVPTAHGDFHVTAYTGTADGLHHMALAMGRPAASPPIVVDECVGQLFSVHGCPHRAGLQRAMAEVAAAGSGVVIYLRSAATSPMCTSPARDPSATVLRAALIRQIHADQVNGAP